MCKGGSAKENGRTKRRRDVQGQGRRQRFLGHAAWNEIKAGSQTKYVGQPLLNATFRYIPAEKDGIPVKRREEQLRAGSGRVGLIL